VRVATFNLWSGRPAPTGGPLVRPGTDPAALARSAAALADLGVDVLAVQEVDVGQPRSQHVDQLAMVAEAFGATAWRFVPTLLGAPGPARGWERAAQGAAAERRVADGPAYGIGLVSRRPVLAWRVRELGTSRARLPVALEGRGRLPRVVFVPDEPRIAVAAVVDGPLGPVSVLSTHLSFAPVAAWRQLRSLVRWAASLPGPRVLAGDLNLPGPLPARLTGWSALARAVTYPSPAPRVQLDHLLTDVGGDVLDPAARTVRLEVSDHLALLADLPGQ
jgi:endonuclease/exonuclease/phosphatase family metal-dependent hydrolase